MLVAKTDKQGIGQYPLRVVWMNRRGRLVQRGQISLSLSLGADIPEMKKMRCTT